MAFNKNYHIPAHLSCMGNYQVLKLNIGIRDFNIISYKMFSHSELFKYLNGVPSIDGKL